MKKITNVEIRANSIRIKFKYLGKWYREPLLIAPTAQNNRIAGNRLNAIKKAIADGSFSYPEEFPDSAHAAEFSICTPDNLAPKRMTFGQMADVYIRTHDTWAAGTRKGYIKTLNQHWLPRWADVPIADLKRTEIAMAVTDCAFQSAKSRNNALIPLRGVFQLAYDEEIIDGNPTLRIKNAKNQRKLPDPFSLVEVERIIDYMRDKYVGAVVNYFEFAFFSGLRPEEQIALRWSDVSFDSAKINVNKAQSSGELKNVKNNQIRDVDLNNRALAVIHRQYQLTGQKAGHVFLNPNTGNPWNDNGKAQRLRYWVPALKAIGIRHRSGYNTRHTYATMLLMADTKVAYAISQMGHSAQMFNTVYARWIDTDAQEAERSKLNDFIA